MTDYDKWLPVATKLVSGLGAKPGILIQNKVIAANFLAQALRGMEKRVELPIDTTKIDSLRSS